MEAFLANPLVESIAAVYCSAERKAIDGAQVIAAHLSLDIIVDKQLGENDRSSTGFLPPDEFEVMANRFFAAPTESVEGWERAIDAQDRIAAAIRKIANEDVSDGNIAIVAHGGVGALALCRFSNYPIDRKYDQPQNGGGNYFCFRADSMEMVHGWKPIDP